MNLSYAWLQEFVATKTAPDLLGENFRMTSSELEGVQSWSERLAGVVVALVTDLQPHPDATKLQIATVDCGDAQPRTIVCGAPNIAKGQTVLVALPGTTLYPTQGEPLQMMEREIRGVTSSGMICALEELGIKSMESGIHVLKQAMQPGLPAAEALFSNDTVIDLEITPNRPDLLSHLGLAREVAAFEHKKLKIVEPPTINVPVHPVRLSVHVENHRDCPRYSAVILDVVNCASPWWLQARLISAGVKPISIVVDITNYCMMELGQPLHAYDLGSTEAEEGLNIEVGRAKSEESISLLDGTTRELTTDDVVIRRGTQVVGLAGIMGGSLLAVHEGTQRILLEAAAFHPGTIRRTSRRLGLRSEASTRFEKGPDPSEITRSLRRAVQLLQEHAQGVVRSKVIDVHHRAAPVPSPIALTFDRLHQVLGVRISPHDCRTILLALGFELPRFSKSGFAATPPSWRADVRLPEDLIEELIRIWGYERLPSTMPTGAVKAPTKNGELRRKSLIRHALAQAGLHETIHLSFVSKRTLERTNIRPENALPVNNPLSEELAFLSPTPFIPLLLNCASVNSGEAELALFEVAKAFTADAKEEERVALLIRTTKSGEHAIRRIKRALEFTATSLNIPTLHYSPAEEQSYAQAGTTYRISSGDEMIGHLFLVSQEVVAEHKIKQGRTIAGAELHMNSLLALREEHPHYQAPSPFPTSTRDLTVTLPQELPISMLDTASSALLATFPVHHWQITDIFTGKPLADGLRAVTVSVTYGAADRTLTDQEIDSYHQQLEQALTSLS
jgi:phenylalanyl-tRNA synthetase beta chain